MSLKLAIRKTIPNMIVHFVDAEQIWASSNYTLYVSKNGEETLSKVTDIKVQPLVKMLGNSRLISRTFRFGIRTLRKLENGVILVNANGKILRLANKRVEIVYSFEKGVGPLRDGWCEDERGNVYIGEYFLNNARKSAVKLLKSKDGGRSWQVIRSMKGIRHIHCVQYDPYEEKIWMGTGDRDEECSISFSEDKGERWIDVGSGNQMLRTVSLLFTEDYVYWGTDTPARQSHIYRYVRRNGRIERLVPVNGPVYYSTVLENGMKFFSTGAEGNSEGKSAAWDNRAHIWASLDGIMWEDLISWEKDSWPYILGYGRVLFVGGRSGNVLAFTTQCLKKIDNTSFFCNVSVEPK